MRVTVDGNEAAASVAYRLSELCSIYPITPSSTMAELADDWSSHGSLNVFGTRPQVIQLQSEAGAAGTWHGALQGGGLATTFTASQGLLLMIPNMYKIAGELTSTVMHVAARSLATQALSIFGDHQDVMAVRQTGFVLLASASVQEAHDLALVAHASTLRARLPFLHFFDGFRTSHELNTIEHLDDDVLRAMVPEELVRQHRSRALSPENPVVRGTAQNPDVHFQARETANSYYLAVPGIVREQMRALGELVGRHYDLVEYRGAPDAERVVVVMGSAAQTVAATVDHLAAKGEKVGCLQIRLYRPFPAEDVLAALPETVRSVAVLDRTKEPGSLGEPLFLDVIAALAEGVSTGARETLPRVIGGRYGLSSKEFTPGMAAAVFAELAKEDPRPRFTVGINDDVTHLSLDYEQLNVGNTDTLSAVFYGMGSDGTVGANKNTIKILGATRHAQAYFVYDSKKSGSQTVSHLRFGTSPIAAPYLVEDADFVACHKFTLLEQVDVLSRAKRGGTFLINCQAPPHKVWDTLPAPVQREIIDRKLSLYVIDADRVAREAGMRGRTNTVLQTCYFAVSKVLPVDEAIKQIKESARKTYAKRGQDVVDRNLAAIDSALANLHQIPVPVEVTSSRGLENPVGADAEPFVRNVTAEMMMGRGELLPVSVLPADGTYPTGTTKYEKRNVSSIVAEWDPDTCIQCGNCAFVCPHGVIRAKFYSDDVLAQAPQGFPTAPLNAAGLPDTSYTLAVYSEDCTGCGMCVDACPVKSPLDPDRKAINLAEAPPREDTKTKVAFFESIPMNSRSRVDFGTVRGTQFLEPLFEFSGACSGCGETPYVKLLSQLFGDRLTVANATGCSSIYGGNLPTTPWTKNAAGRGPAWSNSLFEDNAEFGLGIRLAADVHTELARNRLTELREEIGAELVDAILDCPQLSESELVAQRARLVELDNRMDRLSGPVVEDLRSVADHLLRRSVWLVGGDGWAYDIGYGGLDHVLSAGRDVNILVLDTEVYSNTGGQASKSTPLGSVARFASGGKTSGKKDMAMLAMSYGNVYVARVAMGADPQQTLRAFREAERHDGPSLILAYSHCIAHGIDMSKGLQQQYKATASGHWPLIRYNPVLRESGRNPFMLDSNRPRIPLTEYRSAELRFKQLAQANPQEVDSMLALANERNLLRWQTYEDMASWGAEDFVPDARSALSRRPEH